MPIGKNAIKRVQNNGYSKVNSAAPDMENSEVIEKAVPAAKEEKIVAAPAATPKKSPAKKATAKKATPAKKAEVKKEVVNKPAPKAEKIGKDVEPAVAVGAELPFYLL